MNVEHILILFLGLCCFGLIIMCWWQDNMIQGLQRQVRDQLKSEFHYIDPHDPK